MDPKLMLRCGIWSSLYYLAINIIVPRFYDGYSMMTYTVSELSAIGAPTRMLWICMVSMYPVLFFIFGLGLINVSGKKKILKNTGRLVIGYCIFNTYWPPMHMRGENTGLTDTLHLVWAGITVGMMLIIMIMGAVSMGTIFRVVTIVSILLLAYFGYKTSYEAVNIPFDGSTPTIGLWERLNIGIFLLWIILFSLETEKKYLMHKS